MTSICVLLVTMALSGAAGATANFFLSPSRDASDRTFWSWLARAICGVIAAFTVPLFLSLAQSGIVRQILESTPSASRYNEILVLAGFCIVVAYSSQSFMVGLARRLLSEVGDVKQAQRETAEKIDEVQASVEVVEENLEPMQETSTDVSSPSPAPEGLLLKISRGSFGRDRSSGFRIDVKSIISAPLFYLFFYLSEYRSFARYTQR